MPRGHSLSAQRTSLFISREKGNRYYIQTRHNNIFSQYNLFVGKLKEKKLARKAPVNTKRVYRIVLIPPRHQSASITMISPFLSSGFHLSVRQDKAELPTQRVNDDA